MLIGPNVQTTFANELLHFFQQKNATIVYENQEEKIRYLLPPNGAIFEGTYDSFIHELADPDVIYICDCGKDEYRNPKRCRAFTIVLSSPNRKHYDAWVSADRKILRLYLPMWSRDEVRAVVPAIYPERTTAKVNSDGDVEKDHAGNPVQVDMYEQRFDIFGGCARFVFSPEDDTSQEVLPALATRINNCNLPALINATAKHNIDLFPLGDLTWRLLRIDVSEKDANNKEDYRSFTLNFASDHILGRLVARKEKEHKTQLVELLSEMGANASTFAASLRGHIFERYAIKELAAGGVFRARWEHDVKHVDMFLRFPPSQQRGVMAKLDDLQQGVTLAHCSGT